jgi:ribose transport system permease protein
MEEIMSELEMKNIGEKKKIINAATLQKLLALGALVLLFVFFSVSSPVFATKNNIISILLATAVNGVLAVGVTFVIITGGIDLSIGTGMTFAAVMTGIAITVIGLPIWLGVLVGLATGGLIGFVNGICVAKLKIPAFIATLGMMMITKGLSLVVSGAKPIYFVDYKSFAKISMAKVFSIPFGVIIFFLAALFAHYILNKSILGRYNFAIGSNLQATRLSGINTDRWLIAIHTLTGVFVGLAGIIMAARLNSAQPALGQGYELDAIAACVIGGTSLSGGKGTISGTVIGAFLMSVLLNGLRIMSVPQEWQTVLTGIIVISAVFVDTYRRNKQ